MDSERMGLLNAVLKDRRKRTRIFIHIYELIFLNKIKRQDFLLEIFYSSDNR